MVGQSISHYRIVDQLGQGGMGVVYRAQDTRLRRPVALKFFPRELATDTEAVRRFEREARAASALDHPNICTVYEVDEAEDGRTFIAMACYDGTTLKQRIADGPLDVQEIVDFGTQIAAGLSEAHRKGIVHRDLKPANVIITPDGVVKIVDFGLALLTDESRITKPDATAGTPSYMAPEQVRGDTADHRADIWAIGALLYEMATGRPAFTAEYVEAVMYRIVHDEPSSMAEIGQPLQKIVRRCLAKKPEDRYSSMAHVRMELLSLRDADVADDRRSYAPAEMQPTESDDTTPLSSRLPAALAVAVMVLAALVIGGLVRFPSAALFGGLFSGSGMGELHVAVLPLRVIGSAAHSEAYALGLAEVVTGNLSRLEPYAETSFWVVPTSEILRREVTSADEARRLFGVRYVFDGALQQEGNVVRLTLNLTDATRLRQIDTWTGDFSNENPATVQDEAALQAAQMLRMNVPSRAQDDIRMVGTTNLGANEFYIQGRGYLQRFDDVENISAAVSLFHRALQEDPEFVLATAGLAEGHWRMYQATQNTVYADSALVYGRRVERISDVPAGVYTSLGLVYLGTGRRELALETFGKVLARDPGNIEAGLGRAQALAALGRLDDAEAAYRQAIDLKPDYWFGYHALAVFYYQQGEFEKAAEQFRKEIDLTPDNAYAHSNLGGIYYYQGRWEDAERHFRRAIELAPLWRAFSNLGTLAFHRGRFEEAVALFRRAIELGSSNHDSWGYLAMAHRYAGDRDSSAAALDRAIQLAEERLRIVPDEVVTLSAIAMYRAMLGHEEEARSLIGRISPQAEDDRWIAHQISQTYAILGQKEQAIRWMEAALAMELPEVYVTHNIWLQEMGITAQSPDRD